MNEDRLETALEKRRIFLELSDSILVADKRAR
jgi:hypothetical protein